MKTELIKKTFDSLKECGLASENERLKFRYFPIKSISNQVMVAKYLDQNFLVKFYECNYCLKRLKDIKYNENLAIKNGFCPKYEIFDTDGAFKINQSKNTFKTKNWEKKDWLEIKNRIKELHSSKMKFKPSFGQFFANPDLFRKKFNPRTRFLKDCLEFLIQELKSNNFLLHPCHGDINQANTISLKSEILFIDWDWSDICPRLFDLHFSDIKKRKFFEVSDLEIQIFGCLYLLWNQKVLKLNKTLFEQFMENDRYGFFLKNFLKF